MESTHYNEKFTKYLKEKNIKDKEEHQSSGKISPSKLIKPTLEAVLQLLDVPTDPPSDQSLRYFLRGNTLEEIAIKALSFGRQSFELQAEATYKGCIGFIDYFDKVPHEIKSAGAWTFKSVQKQGKPLNHHALQTAYYALAKNTDFGWTHYIDTDTFKIVSFRVNASDYKDEIDNRIQLIIDSLISGSLPDYTPLEPFHKSVRYCDYSMFFNKKGEEAENILKEYYDFQYKRLKSKKLLKGVK